MASVRQRPVLLKDVIVSREHVTTIGQQSIFKEVDVYFVELTVLVLVSP